MPGTFEPNNRSGTNATIRAIRLLRAELLELLAYGLGSSPHLDDLGPPGPDLADGHLAVDPGVVEELQRGMDCRRRRRMTEPVGDQDPPVPLRLRVRLGVARDE